MDRIKATILVLASVGALISCASQAPEPGTATATFTTSAGEAQTGPLSLARTEDERAHGLMGVTELGPDTGMAFLLDAPSDTSFWMKDTLIPLSVAFWDDDGRVLDILEMTPCITDSCPTYTPRAPYTTALEMNAGWFRRHGVQIGDPVELDIA